jgi:hypothetical protein
MYYLKSCRPDAGIRTSLRIQRRKEMNAQWISIPRPSDEITPGRFFEEWLPEQLKALHDLIKDNAGDLEVSLAFRVTGDGGGEWSVKVAAGEVEIMEGLKPDATITFVLSEDNFVEAVSAQRDDLLPGPHWLKKGGGTEDPAEIGKQIRKGVNLIQSVKGTLLFCAENPEKPFEVLLKFQGELKDKPDTAISIKQNDLRKIAKGETSIVSAFMSGDIGIKGTMNLILQFAPLIMQ